MLLPIFIVVFFFKYNIKKKKKKKVNKVIVFWYFIIINTTVFEILKTLQSYTNAHTNESNPIIICIIVYV